MPHLLVAISPHGYGHLAQVAPVVNRLRHFLPSLKLTLRTTLPEALLQQRIDSDFELQPAADDFGMVQHDALRVDVAQSLQRYRQLHTNWQYEVSRVAHELTSAAPDLLFADVPYLTLAASAEAGIPAVAMCSLNWHAILQGYLGVGGEDDGLLQQMRAGYAAAERFLCPQPSMAMPGLDNLQRIGVVAEPAQNRRDDLVASGRLSRGEKLVLVAMGGIAHRLPLERWRLGENIRYAVPAAWELEHDDCFAIEQAGVSFSELLASSDTVITKPGYGTFTESAVNGVPVLYARRGDWPEEPYLVDWLQEKHACKEVSAAELEQGDIAEPLQELLSLAKQAPVSAEGTDEAARILLAYLSSVG